MPAPDKQLTFPKSATADGTGTASVAFPSVGYGSLLVVSIAILVTPSSPLPTATVYRNTIDPSAIVDTRINGASGTFVGDDTDELYPGSFYIVRWTGAAAGAVCAAVMRGIQRA